VKGTNHSADHHLPAPQTAHDEHLSKDALEQHQTEADEERYTGDGARHETKADQPLFRSRPEQPKKGKENEQRREGDVIDMSAPRLGVTLGDGFLVVSKP